MYWPWAVTSLEVDGPCQCEGDASPCNHACAIPTHPHERDPGDLSFSPLIKPVQIINWTWLFGNCIILVLGVPFFFVFVENCNQHDINSR